MKDNRKSEIKVGIVSFAAIILLIIGITLGKDFRVTSSETIIKFRFPNSGGIQPTSPVVVNGVKRGYVKTVANDRNSVIITAGIDNVEDFKSDVSAKITILEITGGKKIEISPGIVQEKFVNNGEIPGINAADLADIVSLVGELGDQAKGFLKKFDNIADNLDKLIGDGKFTGNLEKIVNNAVTISDDAKSFLDQNLKDLSATLKNIKTITMDLNKAVDKYEPRIDTLTASLNSALSDAKGLITDIKTTMSKLDLITDDVKDITGAVKNNKSLVNTLLYDKNFAVRLDTNLTNLFKFIETIQQHGININARLGTRP